MKLGTSYLYAYKRLNTYYKIIDFSDVYICIKTWGKTFKNVEKFYKIKIWKLQKNWDENIEVNKWYLL